MDKLDELIDSGDWYDAVRRAVKDFKNESLGNFVKLDVLSVILEMDVEDDPNDKYTSILIVKEADAELDENIGPFAETDIDDFVATACAYTGYEVPCQEVLDSHDAMRVVDETIEDYGSFKIKPIFRLYPGDISLLGGEYELDELDAVKDEMAERLEGYLNEYARLPCVIQHNRSGVVIAPKDFEPIYEMVQGWAKDEPEYDIPTEEL